jgi:glycine cleavage system H lipoate-binding protein
MTTLIDILQNAGIFLAGLFVRLLFFLVVLAAVLVPILIVFEAIQGLKALKRRRDGLEVIGGVKLLPRRLYAPGHTWLGRRLLGGLRVGLDDLAQRLFPNLSAVELPKPGRLLRKGEPAIYLRSEGREAFLPSPITGLVVAVNRAVERMPGLLNASPYGRGWLFAIRPASVSYRQLPTGPAASVWFRAEEDRLRHALESELGLAAADGGKLIEHPATLLPPDRWTAVVTSFLGGVSPAEIQSEPSGCA